MLNNHEKEHITHSRHIHHRLITRVNSTTCNQHKRNRTTMNNSQLFTNKSFDMSIFQKLPNTRKFVLISGLPNFLTYQPMIFGRKIEIITSN